MDGAFDRSMSCFDVLCDGKFVMCSVANVFAVRQST